MKYTLPALTLAISAALSGCATPHSSAVSQPVVDSPVPNVAQPLQRQLAEGLYEMALSPQGDALYVASAEGFKNVQGGAVYTLDPHTLNTIGLTHTDLKNFALRLSAEGKTLYVSNSLDGGISAIDTATGKVKNRLLFSERNEKGRPYGARQLLLLNNTLYVGAVADPAQIWVVDATTLKLKTRIKNTGKWMTGLHYSAQTGRVYAANGSGEILVINPRNQRIEQRWKPLGDKPALLLNMAEDSDTGRLFVTDNSKAKTTLVLDIHSGKLLKQLDVGDSLAVQFNKKRHEIYISQRESGKVISLDASRYTLKKAGRCRPIPTACCFPPMVRRCLSPSNSPSIKTTPLKARTASYVST